MSSANDLVERMPAAFLPELAYGLEMTVQFMLDEPMYAVIDKGGCTVHYGETDAADVVLTLADDDLEQLMTGELNGVTAFMTGRLKVTGDLINARKLPSVFDLERLRQ